MAWNKSNNFVNLQVLKHVENTYLFQGKTSGDCSLYSHRSHLFSNVSFEFIRSKMYPSSWRQSMTDARRKT